jgi:hypothetical protein
MRRQFCISLILAALYTTSPAASQTTADSANIVLDVARSLAWEGRSDAARQLFRFIQIHYSATSAARLADSLLRIFPEPSRPSGSGSTGFILFHTLYGGFLGVAIPAAFGADGSGPYGAGLLLGAPIGFFGSRAFARARISTPGQAGIASFATAWGTWQGLAVQQILDIGQQESCSNYGCYSQNSDTAPWAAMVVGGLAGLGTGLVLASQEIPSGTSTLISHSAYWGSWFGVSLGSAFGAEDDRLITTTVIGGNLALLAAIPAATAWRPSSGRVRLTTAAGLAGALAGVGIIFLANVEDDRRSIAIPAATSAIGLIAGAVVTRNARDAEEGPAGVALLTRRDRLRLGVPLPIPAAIPVDERTRRWRPGFRLTLLDAVF